MKNPASQDDFESALRRDAALVRQHAAPSPELAPRVVRAVHQARAENATTTRSTWRWPLVSFAGAAAGALVAVAVFWTSTTPETPKPETPALANVAPVEPGTASAARLWTAIRPEAQALLAHDPLQSEVDALVTDARSAMHFLALNFLPEGSVPQQPRSG